MSPHTDCYYPEAFISEGMLDSGLHQIYWRCDGRRDGIPVLTLHGGPGSGISEAQYRFFDPDRYLIISFDQRGCGRSTPTGELTDNDSAHLLADIEALRMMFSIDSWLVSGGSWGATLALSYAIHYPQRVQGLLLRGVFLGRAKELQWLYQGAAKADQFGYLDELRASVNLKGAYHYQQLINRCQKAMRGGRGDKRVAALWSRWEDSLLFSTQSQVQPSEDKQSLVMALFEASYFADGAKRARLPTLYDLAQIQAPVHIVHGKYDLICPVQTAIDLDQILPNSFLNIVEGGHSSFDPPVIGKLRQIADA